MQIMSFDERVDNESVDNSQSEDGDIELQKHVSSHIIVEPLNLKKGKSAVPNDSK